jgi:hypothetical protein
MQGVPKKTVVLFKSNFPNPLRRRGASINPSFIKRGWVDLEPLIQGADRDYNYPDRATDYYCPHHSNPSRKKLRSTKKRQ